MLVIEGGHHDDPPNRPRCRARVGGHRPGDVSGVAYYTIERDGFRVVATLAKKGEDAVPVRVVAMLAPGHELSEGRLMGDAGKGVAHGSKPSAVRVERRKESHR